MREAKLGILKMFWNMLIVEPFSWLSFYYLKPDEFQRHFTSKIAKERYICILRLSVLIFIISFICGTIGKSIFSIIWSPQVPANWFGPPFWVLVQNTFVSLQTTAWATLIGIACGILISILDMRLGIVFMIGLSLAFGITEGTALPLVRGIILAVLLGLGSGWFEDVNWSKKLITLCILGKSWHVNAFARSITIGVVGGLAWNIAGGGATGSLVISGILMSSYLIGYYRVILSSIFFPLLKIYNASKGGPPPLFTRTNDALRSLLLAIKNIQLRVAREMRKQLEGDNREEKVINRSYMMVSPVIDIPVGPGDLPKEPVNTKQSSLVHQLANPPTNRLQEDEASLSSSNGDSEKRKKVFIGYNKKDRKFLDELHDHLGTIDFWDDTKIKVGANRNKEFLRNLEATKVAVLLVSAKFLNFELDKLSLLLKEADKGEVTIVWVLVRACDYDSSSLAAIQRIDTTHDNKALDALEPNQRAEVWIKVKTCIKEIVGKS